MKNVVKTLLVVSSVMFIMPSHADFGSMLSKKSSKSSGDSYAMQDKLVKAYVSSASNINGAQILLAKAFGLKDLATKLEAEKSALSDGSVSDESSIKRQTEMSEEANKAIQEKIKSGAKISAEGKKQFTKSFKPYVKGLIGTKSVASEAGAFVDSAKSTISSASYMDKMSVTGKLKAGMFVATEIPGYVQSLWDTSKMMVTYGNENKIEVPKDATESIGGMF